MAVREFNFTVGPETSTLPGIGEPSGPDDLISQGYADARYVQGSSAVADLTALAAIAETERRDGDLVLVLDANNLYRFDSASVVADDGNFFIAPAAGSGRWVRVTLLNRALTFTDTTDASSKDTGAVILEGGLGVEKNVHVGGNITADGNLTVTGTTTTIDVDTMEVEDPNILVNRGGDEATANTNKSGFTVSMSDQTDHRIGYESAAVSGFVAGPLGSESEIITKGTQQDITGKKTFDSASGTDFLAIPAPATPASNDGRLYFNSTDKTFHQKDDAGTDVSLVTESEFVNYIDNPSASASLAGWADSGTSVVLTRTVTGAEIPRASERDGALKFSVGAAGSDYSYYRFTLGSADLGRAMALSWLQLAGGTYSSGDLKAELYTNDQADYLGTYTEEALSTDVSGDTLISDAASGFYATFLGTSAYFELRIVRVAGGGGANDFVSLNDVTIQPSAISATVRHEGKVISSAETLLPFVSYLVDTSGGSFTVSLPDAEPGAVIRLTDSAGTWGSNNLILNPLGGNTVTYDTLDISAVWVELTLQGSVWEVRDPVVPNPLNFSGNIDIDGTIEATGLTLAGGSETLGTYAAGTWTPSAYTTVSNITAAPTTSLATYVKIGRLVTLTLRLSADPDATDWEVSFLGSSLPFAPVAMANVRGYGSRDLDGIDAGQVAGKNAGSTIHIYQEASSLAAEDYTYKITYETSSD